MKHTTFSGHATRMAIFAVASAAVAFGGLTSAVNAQAAQAAQPLPAPPPPPRTAPRAPAPERSGVVVAARPYRVQIRTRDGRYVTLQLRNGTVINPLGTTLQPGMRVGYAGRPGGPGIVSTDQIDVLPAPPRGGPGPGPRAVGPPGGGPPPPPAGNAPPPPAGNAPPPPAGNAPPPPAGNAPPPPAGNAPPPAAGNAPPPSD